MAAYVPIVNGKNIEYDGVYSKENEGRMKTEAEWTDQAKGVLKAELKRRNLTYRDLAEKLTAIGIEDSERNLTNKVARGSFTAVFLIQCLEAIGCKVVRLDDG